MNHICGDCQTKHGSNARYCRDCGEPLSLECSQCNSLNEISAKFCEACGTAFREKTPQSNDLVGTSERRQLTVMFCDLVGSTPLSEQIDPEILSEIVVAYREAVAGAIQPYQGHIARYMGDGMLIYFGYPEAHEDDPRRAVLAALAIIQSLESVNKQMASQYDQSIALRIGIHTGLVIAGELGQDKTRERDAIVGDTPNLAARLEAFADTNTVVVSQATHDLIHGYFSFKDLGFHQLKGIAEPVHIFRPVEATEIKTRLDLSASRGLTPLIGRQKEVDLLLDRWQQVKGGNGQVLLVDGEAGIGKSRLVMAFHQQLKTEALSLLVAQNSPYRQYSPFFSLLELWKAELNLNQYPQHEDAILHLEQQLNQRGIPLEPAVPLLAVQFSIPLENTGYAPLTSTPQKQRLMYIEIMIELLRQMALAKPVLFVMEDLHWADPSTLEFLTEMVDQVPTMPLCLCLTYRPEEFVAPWPNKGYMLSLAVDRLSVAESRDMVAGITLDTQLPDSVLCQIVEQTDGVPLYIEELTQSVGKYDTDTTAPATKRQVQIPLSLRDSMMARLDRLGGPKTVAQIASIIGREFPLSLLTSITQMAPAALQSGLSLLVQAELVYQKGFGEEAAYMFKHALVQEAAYSSLLRHDRKRYHLALAETLETDSTTNWAETQPEVIAQHFTLGNNAQKAIEYWLKAGQRATKRSENTEAIAHLEKGLALLLEQAESNERDQLELTFRSAFMSPWLMLKGWGANELETHCERTSELCQQIRGDPSTFTPLITLYVFHIARSETNLATQLAEQLLETADPLGNQLLTELSRFIYGSSFFFRGEFASSSAAMRRARAFYSQDEHLYLAYELGMDFGVASYSEHTSPWFLGYPKLAHRCTQEALALAESIKHPASIGFAFGQSCFLQMFSRINFQFEQDLCSLKEASEEHGMGFYPTALSMFRGRFLALEGDHEQGVVLMEQGLRDWKAGGAGFYCTAYHALLAESYMEFGKWEEAEKHLAAGLTLMESGGERFYEAELRRLKAQLLRQKGLPYEGAFSEAIAVSERQEAISLELRTKTSLAKAWVGEGRNEDARRITAACLDKFSEEFETPDMVEAKALISRLSN